MPRLVHFHQLAKIKYFARVCLQRNFWRSAGGSWQCAEICAYITNYTYLGSQFCWKRHINAWKLHLPGKLRYMYYGISVMLQSSLYLLYKNGNFSAAHGFSCGHCWLLILDSCSSCCWLLVADGCGAAGGRGISAVTPVLVFTTKK